MNKLFLFVVFFIFVFGLILGSGFEKFVSKSTCVYSVDTIGGNATIQHLDPDVLDENQSEHLIVVHKNE